jgi:WD40 domain-containing protein
MLTFEGHPGAIGALAFSPDGETLASGGKGGQVRLWHPPLQAASLPGAGDLVSALAFSPDGRYLVFGGENHVLQVWDLHDRQPIMQTRAEKHPISAVTFVGPGQVLYGIGDLANPVARPSTLFLLDLPKGRPRNFPFDVVIGIRAVVGLPDRRVAAWVTDRKILRLQDITRPPGKAVTLRNDCRALALSSDGRWLAVSSEWDIQILSVERVWPATPTTLGRHRGIVSALAFGPDGRTLFSGGWDNAVRVWDVDRGIERTSYTWPIGNRVTSLAVSPDGLRAAAGGDVGTIAVWDLD